MADEVRQAAQAEAALGEALEEIIEHAAETMTRAEFQETARKASALMNDIIKRYKKPCRNCGAQKPLSEFIDQDANRDGKSCYCRECETSYIFGKLKKLK